MTREATPEGVGRRLAAARLQRGLEQRVVAARAGLAPSYLSRLENGKVEPLFATVMKVAHVLDAEASEIIGPVPRGRANRGPCPVTEKGHCLIDLIDSKPTPERYTAREIRLLRSFAAWLKSVPPNRVRAMEILLDDMRRGAEADRRHR